MQLTSSRTTDFPQRKDMTTIAQSCPKVNAFDGVVC